MRAARPHKKKAALTPREALRAKVQARAAKQPHRSASASHHAPRSAASVAQAEVEEAETPFAVTSEVAGEEAPVVPPAEPSGSGARRDAGAGDVPVSAGKRRAGTKPRKAPAPPPPPEEEKPAPRPGLFQRLLGIFRKPK